MVDDIETGKIGSSFADLLEELGAYEETTVRAINHTLVFQQKRLDELNAFVVEVDRQMADVRENGQTCGDKFDWEDALIGIENARKNLSLNLQQMQNYKGLPCKS